MYKNVWNLIYFLGLAAGVKSHNHFILQISKTYYNLVMFNYVIQETFVYKVNESSEQPIIIHAHILLYIYFNNYERFVCISFTWTIVVLLIQLWRVHAITQIHTTIYHTVSQTTVALLLYIHPSCPTPNSACQFLTNSFSLLHQHKSLSWFFSNYNLIVNRKYHLI